MLVPLFRDPHEGAAVLALPGWIRPSPHRRARYWHMPRSAALHSDGRITVSLWCGPSRSTITVDDFTDEPPDEYRCGTCVGRRQGFERKNGLIFTPRDHWKLPTRCPGEGTDADWRHCFACGARVHSARYPNYGYADHRPAAAFTDRYAPCPRHGWRDMRSPWPLNDMLICGHFRCGYVAL